MAETKHHTITVTQVPDEESDDTTWTIQCPGVTASSGCQLWYPCQEVVTGEKVYEQPDGTKQTFIEHGCSHTATEDEEYDEYTAHGDHHSWIDGEWMTPTLLCALQQDYGSDSLYDIAREVGLGVYEVEISYEGDGEWYASLIKQDDKP